MLPSPRPRFLWQLGVSEVAAANLCSERTLPYPGVCVCVCQRTEKKNLIQTAFLFFLFPSSSSRHGLIVLVMYSKAKVRPQNPSRSWGARGQCTYLVASPPPKE